jgi:hypothetical protein
MVGVLAGAALVGGCTGEPSGDASSGSGSAAASGGAGGVAGDAPAAKEFIVLGEDTPLGPYRQYMAGPAYDFDENLEKLVSATDKREAMVASCMKDAGFTYYPLPYGGAMEELSMAMCIGPALWGCGTVFVNAG